MDFLVCFNNMRANVLTVAFISIASALLQVAFSLTCLPCKETQCKEVQSLRCQGGLARDPCGCCFICAKLEGERCGGPWNIAGVCDKGLVCKPKSTARAGICHKRDSGAKKRFPRCTVKSRSESRRRFFDTSYGHRGYVQKCKRISTTFCTRSCQRCCMHTTTCNPDVLKYIMKTRCQRQRQLFAPKHLFSKNQDVHDDENEINILENNIKG